MDSGQNPTSAVPGNGPSTNPVPPTSAGTPAPVFSAPQPAAPAATSVLGRFKSRRNRSARPNSANRVAAPARPLTPTGDILMDLPATKPKSPINKGLIIGIIIALVAIIGVVVALLLLPKGSGGGISGSNYQQAFNVFANYMVNGTESTEPLQGEYDTSVAYKLDYIMESSLTERQEFFNRATSLFNTFYDSATKNIPEDSNLSYEVANYQADFEAVRMLATSEIYNENNMVAFFTSDSNLAQTIQNNYQPMLDSNIPSLVEYATVKIAELNDMLDYLGKLRENGCLANGKIVESCANNLGGQVSSVYGAIQQDVEVAGRGIVSQALRGCWSLTGSLSAQGASS